ncbi:hypothetical protein R1sor_008782 [Riccia sorocarpa]|uniref:S1 motif domain-containing protein n=1 Tax=Riccia sorocarpa TaxID=122646 RepID=A0ABD3HW29_9MARC
MNAHDYKTPGEVLGWASEYVAGAGTYVWNQKVYASVVGLPRIMTAPANAEDQRPTIEVTREKERGPVPGPGTVVTAKITKLMPRQAAAAIVCVGQKAVREKFTGIIRQQDVRATEIDKVDMPSSFRPGDIVRAEVISLGDSRAYYLSTAKNELGVVSATSYAGAAMVPVSWQEMQCPITGQREPRKVAKVI